MRLSEQVRMLLEGQYKNEILNSFIYEQIANFCDFRGFNYTAKFFKDEADGERGHAKHILDYVAEKSDILNILPGSYDYPGFSDTAKITVSTEFEDYFKNALAIEEKTTQDLTALYLAAIAENDIMTAEFMLPMIKEQAGEINHYQTILDRFAIYPASPSRNHDIDVWIGTNN